MTTPLHRRKLLQAVLGLGAAGMAPRIQACEFFSTNLRVTHPWTRATPASAGHALLGLRFDEVLQDDQLVDVQTPVAQGVVYVPGHEPAGLHLLAPGAGLPLDLPAGRETVLAHITPGAPGPHLRLLRLTQDLEVGRTYPLTLVFKHGSTVKAQLSVDYARFG